ncbi:MULTISPECIES: flagellar protein export ATPase FliI [Paraburkholderia]|uniref:Flagellum-specific ATP synthase n=1 Tax=Paraburkholderia tropica TaxID=92647 RepID=A0ABX5MMX0_9BURK|nr:flagellar protein export ATPase FliI [Paraburkholderia tropica]MBB2998461.1 flagellum-specific ATP synthase [Paraburkholderia tropica]MBB6317503.1 flagellum-specific ATP synthase [Paraburkholderia tropica]MDE1142533.1 flagellar protein export ATPase FliI [Paraburkholderia tropica]PXX15380.1 flagellum-specific ATP synthase [Paraburkholderia tropica]PZW81061.1 flagellum-specific ATP synthase [Paraburkholderia tropica]
MVNSALHQTVHQAIHTGGLTPLEQELALASFGPGVHDAAQTDGMLVDGDSEFVLPDLPHFPAPNFSADMGAAAERLAGLPAAPDSPAPGLAPEPVLAPAPAPYTPPANFDPNNPHHASWKARLNSVRERNALALPLRGCGRLTRAAGLVLEAVGLRLAVGAEVVIELPPGSSLPMAEAEVVGFSGDKLFLMPTTEVAGLLPGARVWPLESAPIADPMAGAKRLPVGWGMLGRVVDASGKPLDGFGPINTEADAPLTAPVINPLNREPIHKVLDVGVRAINALLTVGRGQRMGLFAGSGVGKSVLLGTMARATSAEVIVIGLIGERGREVKEFIEQILGEEGLARSVVVAAPADVSPLLRMQAAAYTTSLAEYFRDQGKHVLLLMDSLTRYAMAQREIALAIGEPPATKGYPPSVFAKLPALVERTGNGPEGGGSITAFYTVLTEGDDQQDPIADSARAILDGHIVLSRALAEAGHYPAIDIEASISRAMTALIDDQHLNQTRAFKQMLSRYQRNRDLINVGAYVSGRDAVLDRAIALYPRIEAFLQQGFRESANYDQSVDMLGALIGQGNR